MLEAQGWKTEKERISAAKYSYLCTIRFQRWMRSAQQIFTCATCCTFIARRNIHKHLQYEWTIIQTDILDSNSNLTCLHACNTNFPEIYKHLVFPNLIWQWILMWYRILHISYPLGYFYTMTSYDNLRCCHDYSATQWSTVACELWTFSCRFENLDVCNYL